MDGPNLPVFLLQLVIFSLKLLIPRLHQVHLPLQLGQFVLLFSLPCLYLRAQAHNSIVLFVYVIFQPISYILQYTQPHFDQGRFLFELCLLTFYLFLCVSDLSCGHEDVLLEFPHFSFEVTLCQGLFIEFVLWYFVQLYMRQISVDQMLDCFFFLYLELVI